MPVRQPLVYGVQKVESCHAATVFGSDDVGKVWTKRMSFSDIAVASQDRNSCEFLKISSQAQAGGRRLEPRL